MTNHIQFTRTSCKLFSISLKLHELIHFNFNFESMIHILIFLVFLLLGQLSNFPFVANYVCRQCYIVSPVLVKVSSNELSFQEPPKTSHEYMTLTCLIFLYITNIKKERIYVFLKGNFIFKDVILI